MTFEVEHGSLLKLKLYLACARQAVRRVLTWKSLDNGSSVFSASNMEAIRDNIASGTSAHELTDANGDVVTISDGPFNTFWGPVEFNTRGQNEGHDPTTVQARLAIVPPDHPVVCMLHACLLRLQCHQCAYVSSSEDPTSYPLVASRLTQRRHALSWAMTRLTTRQHGSHLSLRQIAAHSTTPFSTVMLAFRTARWMNLLTLTNLLTRPAQLGPTGIGPGVHCAIFIAATALPIRARTRRRSLAIAMKATMR